MIGLAALAWAVLGAPQYPVTRIAPGLTPALAKLDHGCTLPAVDPRSKLLALGLYEGAAVSTVNVGETDEETTAATISVEPGRGQITLIASSYGAVVYRFRGATHRLSRVILVRRKHVAVEGVPAAKLTFASAEECDLPYSLYKGPPGLFAPRIQSLLGRPADSQGGAYSLFRAELGTDGLRVIEQPKAIAAGPSQFEQDMARFYPAGIADIDPRRLVSSAPVRRYHVLPSTAGIVQLLREGALVEGTRADLDRWLETAARRDIYKTSSLAELRDNAIHKLLIVRRPITIPVGLCGAHSVTFLAPDPSYLQGSACHSEALFEDGSAQSYTIRVAHPGQSGERRHRRAAPPR